MDKVDLNVGDVVVFTYPYEEQKKKWTVQATSDRFVILTSRGYGAGIIYTILDWGREVRGPVNLTGGGYPIKRESLTEDVNHLLEDLHDDLEVSYRNNVPIKIKEVIRKE